MTPILKESGIPHYTQMAFQSGISTLVQTPRKLSKKLSGITFKMVPLSTSASMILRRLLIQLSTASFSTTSTDQESMERPGGL